MATSRSMRQSCDRCHSQKLRCERDGESETGACTRCIRQGSQCVYSSSLPKGRPGQQRLNTFSDESTSKNKSQAASKRRALTPLSLDLRRPIPASRTNTTVAGTASTVTLGRPTSATTDTDESNISAEDTGLASLISSSGDAVPPGDSNWPWFGLWNWSDTQQDSGRYPEGHTEWANLSNQDDTFMSHFNPVSDQRAHTSEWFTAATNEANTKDDTIMSQEHQHWPDHLGLKANDGPNIDAVHYNTLSINESENGSSIAQLTKLSTHLYSLHCSSHALVSTAASLSRPASKMGGEQHNKRSLVVDKTVFRSVMTRLLQGCDNKSFLTEGLSPPEVPTINDTLQDALSATHRLLEILHRLEASSRRPSASTRGSPLAPIPTPKSMDGPDQSQPSRSAGSGLAVFSGAAQLEAGAIVADSPSNIVVSHLVMACHGILLSIYAALLDVLQQDADAIVKGSHHLQGRTADSGAATAMVDDMDPLPDMRLVTIIQLCSYLVARQQQAVNSYVSRQRSFATIADSLGPLARGSSPNDLEIRVQQRLTRLRQTLRI